MALRLPASLAWPCAAVALGGAGHAVAGPAALPPSASGAPSVSAVRLALDPADPTRIAGVRLAVGAGASVVRVRLGSSGWTACRVRDGSAACALDAAVADAAALETAASDD